MSFVIYHKETTQIYTYTRHNPWRRVESYKTMSAAKAALTRLHKKWLQENNICVSNDGPMFEYGIADKNWFHDFIEKQVVKRNLITGEEFTEPTNRPYYCSPSSESYWSM